MFADAIPLRFKVFDVLSVLLLFATILVDFCHYSSPKMGGQRSLWLIAWTHWSLVACTAYFVCMVWLDVGADSAVSHPLRCLEAACWASSLNVTLSYWVQVYPALRKNGLSIWPTGLIKHGGSIGCLFGSYLLRGLSLPQPSGNTLLVLVAMPGAYLMWQLFRHYYVIYPRWEPAYCATFAANHMCVLFVCGPLIAYVPLWLALPAFGEVRSLIKIASEVCAFSIFPLLAFDALYRARHFDSKTSSDPVATSSNGDAGVNGLKKEK